MNAVRSNHLDTKPDVLVIGAGAAGVAAVAGAATTGATVTLLERNEIAGGKATVSNVGTICGLFYRSKNKEPRFVHGGFPKWFAEKLMALDKSAPVTDKNGLFFLPYNEPNFVKVCESVLNASANAVSFNTNVSETQAEDGKIVSVTAVVNNEPVLIYPKAVVDATGTTVLSQHELDPSYSNVSIVPGSFKNGSALFKLGLPMQVAQEPTSQEQADQFARKAVPEVATFLKQRSEFFSGSSLGEMAEEAGIRTGPRNMGKYILKDEDVMSCAKFPDGIARGAWPVEHWQPGKYATMDYFDYDDGYDIPVGSLQSKFLDNLFFGGRNISATEMAIASARVIGTCLATGYAAGMLAAGYVYDKPFGETISETRKSLSL